jgi:hypothetical protein
MKNKEYIQCLLDKSTDLISSQNLAQLKIIDVIGDENNIEKLFNRARECQKNNPNNPFFVGIVVPDGTTVENVEGIIDKFEDYEFILFNNPSIEFQINVLKKYAPWAKISYLGTESEQKA